MISRSRFIAFLLDQKKAVNHLGINRSLMPKTCELRIRSIFEPYILGAGMSFRRNNAGTLRALETFAPVCDPAIPPDLNFAAQEVLGKLLKTRRHERVEMSFFCFLKSGAREGESKVPEQFSANYKSFVEALGSLFKALDPKNKQLNFPNIVRHATRVGQQFKIISNPQRNKNYSYFVSGFEEAASFAQEIQDIFHARASHPYSVSALLCAQFKGNAEDLLFYRRYATLRCYANEREKRFRNSGDPEQQALMNSITLSLAFAEDYLEGKGVTRSSAAEVVGETSETAQNIKKKSGVPYFRKIAQQAYGLAASVSERLAAQTLPSRVLKDELGIGYDEAPVRRPRKAAFARMAAPSRT